MLLGVVLLYVGAVLVVNGIWLIGQARVASSRRPASRLRCRVGRSRRRRRRPPRAVAAAAVENHPMFIQNREVAVINIFTGFVGVAVSPTLLVQGNARRRPRLDPRRRVHPAVRVHLPVGGVQRLPRRRRPRVRLVLPVRRDHRDPGRASTRSERSGQPRASIWLGINWFAWGVLWALFFVLLALDRPIARMTGMLAIIEGIGTAWVFGFLLLEGTVKF